MQERPLQGQYRYLLVPLADTDGMLYPPAPPQILTLYANGCVAEEIEVYLSASPRCVSPLDLRMYAGMALTVRLEGGDEALIDLLTCSNALPALDPRLEKRRPAAHITPFCGFMNDPNGLVHYRGRYHYFAQLNPYGFTPGNTCWMHLVSRDLVHWRRLPHTLLPDESGLMYSGCGVVDEGNVSGMAKDGHAPIFLFYTSAGSKTRRSQRKLFTVGAAVSVDGGENFTKLPQNPLVEHIAFMNRDPKVAYCPEQGEYVMALYLDNDRYQLLFSRDLLSWRQTQVVRVPGCSECPDIFRLPLDGDDNIWKWVLWGSTDNYVVGTFENGIFIQEGGVVQGPSHRVIHADSDRARSVGSYAAQTYSGLPGGRVVQQSWIQTRTKGLPFVCCASLPNEVRLISTPGGPRLSILPAKEVEALARKRFSFRYRGVEDLDWLPREAFSECMDIALTLRYAQDHPLAWSVRGVLMAYDPRRDTLLLPTGMYQLQTTPGELGLRIVTDRCSVEIYTLDGLFYTTLATVLDPAITDIKVVSLEMSVSVDIDIAQLDTDAPCVAEGE